MPFVYNLVLFLASPMLLAYLFYRLVVLGKSRSGLGQRLGLLPALPAPGPEGRVWMHAVSAGEMVAAAAIARRLREQSPTVELVVSTTTPAGMLQAQRLIPWARSLSFFPFDLLPCVLAGHSRWRATVVVCVETEIWPNWLWVARVRGSRLLLLNGQFADRGFRKAIRVRPLYAWALGLFDRLLMQSAQAADRARLLGAAEDRVEFFGNAKFDQPHSPPSEALVQRIRQAFGEVLPPLWVAGSTHPGEDEAVLGAHAMAAAEVPGLRLLLAPRHIERADEVVELAARRGLRVGRRTGAEADVQVLVLDTMGELASAYAFGSLVFVGGSLVPIGGHDILQPLMHGKPVLFGPAMHNQAEVAVAALGSGAAVQVSSADGLAREVVRLLTDPGEVEARTSGGRELLRRNSGAAGAYARAIVCLLPSGGGA